ncbi:hypothetical protein M9Y10_037611 [Tritrichomonas musculus]|uniref:Uncharacterized protein n=1 Tax=Tritrichomonas musculus TaxID=1915356 RepID=A0ABR2GRW4_9EUKA
MIPDGMEIDSIDEPCQCCQAAGYCVPISTRANIRHARGMSLNYCQDCCQETFCPFCFTVQNIRELKLVRSECQVHSNDMHGSTTIIVNGQTLSYPPPGGYPPQEFNPPQGGYHPASYASPTNASDEKDESP